MSVRTPLKVAILTVSDTRSLADDASGDLLVALAQEDGHQVVERDLQRDDIYQIRARISQWIAAAEVQVIVTTGGTGFTGRDSTPEALAPLFDKSIDGFGELFRQISHTEIGASTMQSRALGGLANGTLIFALPGSKNAVRTGWTALLRPQLDIDFKPCNFAELIPRFREGQ